jgi:ATP-dependent Clp protease protease subunit
MEGYAPDVERMVNELLRLQRVGSELLAKATGRSAEEIEQDFSRDRFMTPQEAKDYGFIDEILNESSGAAGV